ncbi:MAG: hypothetical protein ABSA14_15500 [Acidimicrobiales bacterium]
MAKELDANVTANTALLVPERFAELLGDLTSLRVEPTDDYHHAGLLRVYLPHTVVGFWYCWSSCLPLKKSGEDPPPEATSRR